jgi:hypothetical protein
VRRPAIITISDIAEESRIAAGGMGDFARGLITPSVRLGVTGLSRAGKTVFTTALVHNLLRGGRLPMLDAAAEGRLVRAYLQPQPDYDLPRFAYENHVATLRGEERSWPQSTRRISQMRLTLEYQPTGFLNRRFSRGLLNLDIIDYPGEWLLDLPLLQKSYEQWSAETIAASDAPARASLAKDWRTALSAHDQNGAEDEPAARALAETFTAYLQSCRTSERALSVVPPGRFLMPGDLAGSPLLTFAPLDVSPDGRAPKGSLWGMMAARYDAYLKHVVKPFYRDHFARLDRQIVLVDVLSTLNAGPHAVEDLRAGLTDILASFRPGRASWLSSVLGKRIDRILFAATKADHLHHLNHDRLEAATARLVRDAIERAEFKGAKVDVLALAAIRATREATVSRRGEDLPCIVGIPAAGEKLGDKVYLGDEEAVLFPGDLPEDADELFGDTDAPDTDAEMRFRFMRFRPPQHRATSVPAVEAAFPHIRLDRALNFLVGDYLA